MAFWSGREPTSTLPVCAPAVSVIFGGLVFTQNRKMLRIRGSEPCLGARLGMGPTIDQQFPGLEGTKVKGTLFLPKIRQSNVGSWRKKPVESAFLIDG